MSVDDGLDGILAFLRTAERLKSTPRSGWTTAGERESVEPAPGGVELRVPGGVVDRTAGVPAKCSLRNATDSARNGFCSLLWPHGPMVSHGGRPAAASWA